MAVGGSIVLPLLMFPSWAMAIDPLLLLFSHLQSLPALLMALERHYSVQAGHAMSLAGWIL